MLTVACYLWGDAYSVGDVRLLRDMVARHLSLPHDFACITDNVEQFDGTGIRAVPLLRRYRRGLFEKLMTFHPDAASLIGERLLVLDLDTVVTGSLDDIASCKEDLVLWRNPCRQPWVEPEGKARRRALYNTSIVLIRAGCRPDIWNDFQAVNVNGTDQDWVSYRVGPNSPYWDDENGIYRLAREDTPGSGITGNLPPNARIVFFAGSEHKPWRPEIREQFPWIEKHRR